MFTTQDWEWFMYTTYISGEIREWFMAYGIALPTFVDFQEKKHQQQIQGKKRARANPLATLMVVLLWLLIKIYVI